MILEHEGLIHIVLKRFYFNPFERDDLIQIGYIALMKASEKFDTTLGFKFSTYAIKWIYSYINRYLKRNDTSDLIPLDKPLSDDTDSKILDTITDTGADKPFKYIDNLDYNQQLRADLYTAMYEKNTPQEQQFLIMYYGLDDNKPMQIVEIARLFEVTNTRIYTIRQLAISKLRNNRHLTKYKDDIKQNISSKKYDSIECLMEMLNKY